MLPLVRDSNNFRVTVFQRFVNQYGGISVGESESRYWQLIVTQSLQKRGLIDLLQDAFDSA